MGTVFRPHPNNVSTTLASGYAAGGNTLTLAAGTGAQFGTTFPMLVTVAQIATYGGPTEVSTIYSVTARTGDVLTFTPPSQEGTTDRNYAVGDRVEVRWTSGLAGSIETAVNNLELGYNNLSTGGLSVNQTNNTDGTLPIHVQAVWNNASVSMGVIVAAITDTASAAGSFLQVFQVGGVNKWVVDKTGHVVAGNADAAFIITGTIAPARLGGGTPQNPTWLRGDGVWTSFWPLAGGVKTSNYTMAISDRLIMGDPSAGAFTVTLPPASAAVGNEYVFTNSGTHATNTITIQRQGTDGIGGLGAMSPVASITLSCATQFKFYRLLCATGTTFVVVGSG